MRRHHIFNKRRYLGCLVLLLLSISLVNADEIHLKSGQIIKTSSVREKDGLVVYERRGGTVSISKELVREIVYSRVPQASAVLRGASEPVAYYPFEGNADDRLNPKNNGVVSGARLVADRLERLKSSYRFDGADDYIQVNAPVLPKPPFSVSFWFNASAIRQDARFLLSNGGQAGSLPGLYCKLVGKKETAHGKSSWPKSGIQCGIHDTEQNFSVVVTRESLTANEWHHVLLAWDGIPEFSHVSLYIDGGLASVLMEMQAPQFSDHVDVLRIGAPNNSISMGLFKGVIDEIRFYDRVLSLADIQQLNQSLLEK